MYSTVPFSLLTGVFSMLLTGAVVSQQAVLAAMVRPWMHETSLKTNLNDAAIQKLNGKSSR